MTSCVGRFRRDERTRKDWLLFILHRQSFTIIQPDRRLIAVTPSPRWACPLRRPPFSLNSEEPSPLFIYRSREEKELEEECESGFTRCSFLHFAHFPSRGFYFSEHYFPNPQQTNKTGSQGRLSTAIVMLFFCWNCVEGKLSSIVHFQQWAAVWLEGRHFGTETGNEFVPQTQTVFGTVEVMEEQESCWAEILVL